MYFLRQIISETKAIPAKIPNLPETSAFSKNMEQNSGTGEGVLWIIDQGQRAQELLRQGCPVLAWLHEDNRDQDFSGVRYACENPEELDFDYLEKVYRRYVGIPWDILTTDRCLVRETSVEDLDAFYEMYAEPSVTQYTEGLYPERTQEEAYLQDYTEHMYYFYNYGVWTICEKTTGQIIGRAGFSNREGYEDPGKRNWDLSRCRCWWCRKMRCHCDWLENWGSTGRIRSHGKESYMNGFCGNCRQSSLRHSQSRVITLPVTS